MCGIQKIMFLECVLELETSILELQGQVSLRTVKCWFKKNEMSLISNVVMVLDTDLGVGVILPCEEGFCFA